MGTNYYHKDYAGACPTCGQVAPSKHIGKSSWGWPFGLHIYPEDGIVSLHDWFKRLEDGGVIENEYGEVVDIEYLRTLIANREFSRTHEQDGRFCVGHADKCDLLVGEFS